LTRGELTRQTPLVVRRNRRFRAARAAIQLFAPSLVLVATALPARANDGLHGFVDPCALSFVEDNTNECELCAPAADDAEACKRKLVPHGYQLKCRTTPGHSQPGEIWCRPRPGFSLPRPAPPPPPEERSWTFKISVLVAGALGAFLLIRHQGRKRKRTRKSASDSS
jgi:hypothetical protein